LLIVVVEKSEEKIWKRRKKKYLCNPENVESDSREDDKGRQEVL